MSLYIPVQTSQVDCDGLSPMAHLYGDKTCQRRQAEVICRRLQDHENATINPDACWWKCSTRQSVLLVALCTEQLLAPPDTHEVDSDLK